MEELKQDIARLGKGCYEEGKGIVWIYIAVVYIGDILYETVEIVSCHESGGMDHHGIAELALRDEVVQSQKDLFGPFEIVFAISLYGMFVDCPRGGPLFRVGHIELSLFTQNLGQIVESLVNYEGKDFVYIILCGSNDQFRIQKLISSGYRLLLSHLLFQQFQIFQKLRVSFQSFYIQLFTLHGYSFRYQSRLFRIFIIIAFKSLKPEAMTPVLRFVCVIIETKEREGLLNQRVFEQKVRERLFHSLMLYGENDYMMEYYLELYKKTLDASESMLSLYYEEYDFKRAKEYISQSSLFGGNNLLVVRSDRKIAPRELATLVELSFRGEGNYFLFLYTGEVRKASTMSKSFDEKRGAAHVRLFETNYRDAMNMLNERASQLGMQMEPYAMEHLYTLLNGKLSLAMNELEKLSIRKESIGRKEIDAMVYSAAPVSVDEVLLNLFEKRDITDTLEKLLELGENENSILRALQRFVQNLFLFHSYIRLHAEPDSREILGYRLPPQLERRIKSIVVRLKPATIGELYELVMDYELRMKSSRPVSTETLLYALFIKAEELLARAS